MTYLLIVIFTILIFRHGVEGHRQTTGVAYFGGVDENGEPPEVYGQIINPEFHNTKDIAMPAVNIPQSETTAVLFSDGYKNKLYVCGGRKPTGGFSNACFCVATFLDDATVTQETNLLEVRTFHSMVALGDKAYVCGGLGKVNSTNTELTSCEMLNIGQCHSKGCLSSQVKWVPTAPMKEKRYGHVALAVSNTQFCVFGGRTGAASTNMYSALITKPVIRNSVECYDATTNTWMYAAPMLNNRTGHAGVVMNGFVYLCGGTFDGSHATNSCEKYFPITNQWSAAGTLAEPRVDHTMVVFRSKIYALGGSSSTGACTDSIELYDWATEKSQILPDKLAGARSLHAAVAILF